MYTFYDTNFHKYSEIKGVVVVCKHSIFTASGISGPTVLRLVGIMPCQVTSIFTVCFGRLEV